MKHKGMLKKIFDYQRYEKNPDLSKLIHRVERKYHLSKGEEEAGDDWLTRVDGKTAKKKKDN